MQKLAAGLLVLAFLFLAVPASMAPSANALPAPAHLVKKSFMPIMGQGATKALPVIGDPDEGFAGPSAPSSANMFCWSAACTIQKTPVVYLIFVDFITPSVDDPSGEASYITNFFSGVGGSNWAGIQTQYSETARGAITNPASQLGGVWYDNSVPNLAEVVPDEFIYNEALSAVTHFGYNADANYMIFTPSHRNTAEFGEPGVGYCAWHTSTTDSLGRPVAFSNMPYNTDAPLTCGKGTVNGSVLGVLDGVSIVSGHEYAETVTDPIPVTGWAGPNGGSDENGDKCAWVTTGPGAMQNIHLSTGVFAVQGLWDNKSTGCAITDGGALVAHAGGPYSGLTNANIPISGYATGGTSPYTCTWSSSASPAPTFGSTTACSTTVKFTSPGSYSITLTSGDSASPAGSATNTATVTVTNPPLSANAGGPYSGTASTAVSLTGSATGGTSPYSCAWTGSAAASFTGSGCTGTSVTYTAAGTYTVTLTVTDSASPAATATSTATVTIGSAGAVCQTDSASDAGFGAVPDPTGVYEITNACAQNLSGTSQVKITMDIAGMATENLIGGTIGSPAVSYEAFVDSVSRSWTAQHALGGAGWVLYHGTAVSSGSASSTSTTLTILIPYSEISASATYHATSFRVASALPVVGYTHINDGVVADQVPNTGSKTI